MISIEKSNLQADNNNLLKLILVKKIPCKINDFSIKSIHD